MRGISKPKPKPTQKQEVVRWLKEKGKLSAYEAAWRLGILQLSSRIGELEAMGWIFSRRIIVKKNRYGRRVHYMEYSVRRRGIMP